MLWLVLGLLLWAGAHVFRRAAPGPRAAMQARMGDASKGVIAGLLVLAIVLMVIGYRGAEVAPVWNPPAWTRHLNNLLVLVAVLLFAASHSKSRLRARLRHPQLSAVILWAIAHLLVNGSLAAIVLFGGLLLWAMAEIAILNAAESRPVPYAGGSLAGDIRLVAISVAVYLGVGLIHGWIGPWPFPT